MTEITISPWQVQGDLTSNVYTHLINKFGVQALDTKLLDRFQKIIGQELHPLLRRGLCFAHRDFEAIMDDIEKNKPIFIYTGRGPSTESLHMGHIVPLDFTVWLQSVLPNAVVIIQMADDEKFWFKDMTFDEVYHLGRENSKDIIAMGFDPDRTFIFSNRDFGRNEGYQRMSSEIMKRINVGDIMSIFGLEKSANVGQLVWPIYQTTAAFSRAFDQIFRKQNIRCLVTYAIDQDPYFRLARDIAPKMNLYKPCALIFKFLPSLEGKSKMSSSGPSQKIFINDKAQDVRKKINKYAFSGGKDTIEEHRKFGGNTDVDISFQWLTYFMENDLELARISDAYTRGELLSGQLKKLTIDVINHKIQIYQARREKIDEDLVKKFYDCTKF